MVQLLWESIWYFPQKSSKYIYCLIQIFHSKIFLQEKRKLAETCTQMFVAILLVVTPNWKIHKCLSAIEWINNGIAIQWTTTKQYKGTNYWYMLQYRWMLKKCRVKKGQKSIYYSISFIENFFKKQTNQ